MNMKKVFLFILIFTGTFFAAYADLPSDPNDRLYKYIDLWEGKGIISRLPPMRPYSVQYLTVLLNKVAGKGGKDGEIAKEFLKSITSSFSLHPSPGHESRFTGDYYYGESGSDFPFTGIINDIVSYSGRAGIWLVDRANGDLLLPGDISNRDYLEDWSDVGRFLVRQSLNLSTSVGNGTLWLNTGLTRASFGPFPDNGLVLGPQAPATGQFDFTWRLPKSIFTTATLLLTASDNSGAGRYPQKFLALHGLNLFPNSWLEIGLFESEVYGGRLEPLYMIPLSEFFYFQGVIGFPDNSMLGMSAKIRFLKDFQYAFLLYIDDMHFNDMIRFHFDTKYKIALQTGVFWTPLGTILKRIAVDYTMVTPYTYSHKQSGTINYQNYTTAGVNLGPDLEPNSDRITITFLLTPFNWLDVKVNSLIIRHGNASAGITDGDGTIFDDGYDAAGVPTFQETTRFLTQDILEHTYKGGVEAKIHIKAGKVSFEGKIGYAFEYLVNKDFQTNSEFTNLITLGAGVSF